MRSVKPIWILAFTLLLVGGLIFGSQAFVGAAPGLIRGPSPHQAEVDRTTFLINEDSRKPKFDGLVHGWRIAPEDALAASGVADRNLAQLDCEPTPAGAETQTNLDVVLGYFPTALKVESSTGPNKWVCGSKGLSVSYDYNVSGPLGAGGIWVERALWGRRSQVLSAATDKVEAGEISGHPAIFIHPLDNSSGLGLAEIIVIEDDTGPKFRILRLTSNDAVSFEELVKIAGAVK